MNRYAALWFSHFFEKAFVSRVIRRIDIRTVRLFEKLEIFVERFIELRQDYSGDVMKESLRYALSGKGQGDVYSRFPKGQTTEQGSTDAPRGKFVLSPQAQLAKDLVDLSESEKQARQEKKSVKSQKAQKQTATQKEMNCPIRNSPAQKYGKDRRGQQRFHCLACNKTFIEEQPKPLGQMILAKDKALMCLQLLVEGNSVRSTERITGVHRDTVLDLLVTVGDQCEHLMQDRIRGLTVRDVECDEVWGFVG